MAAEKSVPVRMLFPRKVRQGLYELYVRGVDLKELQTHFGIPKPVLKGCARKLFVKGVRRPRVAKNVLNRRLFKADDIIKTSNGYYLVRSVVDYSGGVVEQLARIVEGRLEVLYPHPLLSNFDWYADGHAPTIVGALDDIS